MVARRGRLIAAGTCFDRREADAASHTNTGPPDGRQPVWGVPVPLSDAEPGDVVQVRQPPRNSRVTAVYPPRTYGADERVCLRLWRGMRAARHGGWRAARPQDAHRDRASRRGCCPGVGRGFAPPRARAGSSCWCAGPMRSTRGMTPPCNHSLPAGSSGCTRAFLTIQTCHCPGGCDAIRWHSLGLPAQAEGAAGYAQGGRGLDYGRPSPAALLKMNLREREAP